MNISLRAASSTSMPVYAIVVANFARSCTKYFRDVFNYDMT
uniref:Uncharacterized protein n=1 Tax=Macrostomum lignano TaxID=282301 RepID=A0A1I8FM86_9PLAT